MMLSLTVLMILVCTLYVEADNCPYGFLRNDNSCYWFSNIKSSFGESVATCQYLHSKLATITSEAENKYIEGYINRYGKGPYYLFDANDFRHEGTWTMENPSRKISFSKWLPGEPSNYIHVDKMGEQCAATKGPGWVDVSCSLKYHFICETHVALKK